MLGESVDKYVRNVAKSFKNFLLGLGGRYTVAMIVGRSR